MPFHSLKPCAALTLLLCAALPAWAGRPLQTDDAGVLERAECELEAFSARTRADSGSDREHTAQVGCGIGADTQLALAASQVRISDGDRAQSLALNGKTRLWQGDGGDDAPSLALGYQLALSRSSTGGWERSALSAALLYTRPLSDTLSLHVNLGHLHDKLGGQGATIWGVALEATQFGPIAPMAEVFGSDREAPRWNLGMRWSVTKGWFLDLSHGRHIAPGRRHMTTLGTKLEF